MLSFLFIHPFCEILNALLLITKTPDPAPDWVEARCVYSQEGNNLRHGLDESVILKKDNIWHCLC